MFQLTHPHCRRRLAVAALCLAAALLSDACGVLSPETREARELGKILAAETGNVASLVTREQQVVASIRQWAGLIGFAGVFGEANQKAEQALSMNGELRNVANEYGRILGRFESFKPATAPVQVAATQITSFLRQRVDYLGGISTLLTASAQRLPGFQGAYNMSFPGEISQINRRLSSYAPPADVFSLTLNDLRIKYKLTDSDLK